MHNSMGYSQVDSNQHQSYYHYFINKHDNNRNYYSQLKTNHINRKNIEFVEHGGPQRVQYDFDYDATSIIKASNHSTTYEQRSISTKGYSKGYSKQVKASDLRQTNSLFDIASNQRTGQIKSNLISQHDGLQETGAAYAMIRAVRFTLVILIGVLVIKLLLLNKQNNNNNNNRTKRSNKTKSDDHEGNDIKEIDNINYKRRGENKQDKQKIRNQKYLDEEEKIRIANRNYLTSLKLPPGPTGLPFLGYLPFMSQEVHVTLTQLSERYGPIYQIYLGGIRVVVLNDASLVRQAFKQPVFSGRPDTQLTRILQGYGIVNTDGELWREQRAFLHTALRKLGAKSLMNGSNGLEAKIQNQVREFVDDLKEHATMGKSCQVRPFVARAVSSVVGSIVMNLTYRKEKEKFDRLIELMQEGFRLFAIAMPLNFIPIFRFLPGVSYAYKKIKKNRTETSAFFKTFADEHRKYLSENFNLGVSTSSSSELHPKLMQLEQEQERLHTEPSKSLATCETSAGLSLQRLAIQVSMRSQLNNEQTSIPLNESDECLSGNKSAISSEVTPSNKSEQTGVITTDDNRTDKRKQNVELDQIVARDLVDAYIIQQKRHEKDGKENYFSDKQLVQIMSDIFSAGLETVTSTIEWSILFMILNPECQQQVQEEIDQVVGRDRMPQLDDLSRMPYTEAFIYEVLRRSNVVALGNAHAALDDASIGGYLIPKGTQVLPNLYGINMNAKLWENPTKFDPNRFLVNNKAKKPDYFIPFSVGRRVCLGDLLAKMEVFLFLVGLLQKFDLSVANEDKNYPPKVEGTIGLSNAPVSFRVALQSRPSITNINQN